MIGLRLYRVQIYHNHKVQKLTNAGGPTDLSAFTASFVAAHSSKRIKSNDSKTIRFVSEPDVGNSQHGLVRYGTYGYETEAEDINSGVIVHKRTKDQADTIPLYYRFWHEPGRSYGLWAFQSYGGRSCVDMVRHSIRDSFQAAFPEYSLQVGKIMPNDAKLYGQRPVRRIILVQKQFPSNRVNAALQPEKPGEDLKLELSVMPQRRGYFGKLKDVTDKLGGNLVVENLQFGGAFAEVVVGKSIKKIGILGVSTTAGVIDVTDDVTIDPVTAHPTLASIAKVTADNIVDFAKALGP